MSTANTDTGAWNRRLNFFVIFLLIILVKRRCVHQAFTSEVTPLYKGKIAKKTTVARGAVVRNLPTLQAREFVTGM